MSNIIPEVRPMESTVRQYEVTDDECEWIKPYFTEGRE